MRCRVPHLTEPAGEEPASMAAPHCFGVRVYYEDTDFSGFVYHASYLRFFERARTEFLRSLGIEHRAAFANGGEGSYHFVVRAMSIDFLKPAVMDDQLLVETGCETMSGAAIQMVQKIRRGEEVLVTASVKVAIVSGGKARRIPQGMLARLKSVSRV